MGRSDHPASQPSSWQDQAACRPYPTWWWFTADRPETVEASVICTNCEVGEACLGFALDHPELVGIWAATTNAHAPTSVRCVDDRGDDTHGSGGAWRVRRRRDRRDSTPPSTPTMRGKAEILRDALSAHAVVCVRLSTPMTDDEARAVGVDDRAGEGSGRPHPRRRSAAVQRRAADRRRRVRPHRRAARTARRPQVRRRRPAARLVRDVPHRRHVHRATGGGDGALRAGAPGGSGWRHHVHRHARPRTGCSTKQQRRRLDGLRAVHATTTTARSRHRVPAEGPYEALVDVAYPIVRAHPVTGEPALYFDLDHAPRTSKAWRTPTVGRCSSRCRITPSNTRRDTRTAGSRTTVVIWDNASVQHKAAGDFPVGEPRNFWRYMIEGRVPVAAEPPSS